MLRNIYLVGSNLEYVKRGVRYGWKIFDDNYLYDGILRVQRCIEELGFSGDIESRLDSVLKLFKKLKDEETDTFVDPEKTLVLNNIEALNGLILNKLNELIIFQAVKECALDKDCLIKLSNKEKTVMFDDRVWDELSDIAKSDYSDSAKCILTGAATPATMISLRAAEEEVRTYYTFKTGNEPGRKNWGTLITELKKEPDLKEELLNHLDYIRNARNIAQHPDKIYNQREAERIFMNVISMVHDIHEDMK